MSLTVIRAARRPKEKGTRIVWNVYRFPSLFFLFRFLRGRFRADLLPPPPFAKIDSTRVCELIDNGLGTHTSFRLAFIRGPGFLELRIRRPRRFKSSSPREISLLENGLGPDTPRRSFTGKYRRIEPTLSPTSRTLTDVVTAWQLPNHRTPFDIFITEPFNYSLRKILKRAVPEFSRYLSLCPYVWRILWSCMESVISMFVKSIFNYSSLVRLIFLLSVSIL